MDNILTQIDIDLYETASYQVIKAQQGDKNSRIIELSLYDRGEPYEPSGNITFRFIGHRGDGSSFLKEQEDCITRNGNRISIKLLEDILYYDGIIEAKLVMYEGMSTPEGKVLSTIPFRISCIKNPYNDSNMEPGKYSIVTDLISKVDKFSESAQDYVDQAKSYAVGGAGKRENEDEDNAKYYYEQTKIHEGWALQYSEQAGDALSAAEAFANVSEEKSIEAADYADDASRHANSALTYKFDASNYSSDALKYATRAQSYANGESGSRDGEESDNAKYYYELAKDIKDSLNKAGACIQLKRSHLQICLDWKMFQLVICIIFPINSPRHQILKRELGLRFLLGQMYTKRKAINGTCLQEVQSSE